MMNTISFHGIKTDNMYQFQENRIIRAVNRNEAVRELVNTAEEKAGKDILVKNLGNLYLVIPDKEGFREDNHQLFKKSGLKDLVSKIGEIAQCVIDRTKKADQ